MPKFSVKKPFTVLVAVLAIIILGAVSIVKMQLDLLPQISLPYLMVITTYPGASSGKVEEEVCKPMEASLGIINGVKNVSSTCSENYGMVQLEFEDNVNIDSAMVKVSSALNTLESSLPEECGTPSIIELSSDMLATAYMAVSMEGMTMEELSQFEEENIRPAFERIDGVASVSSMGLINKTIQIELNKGKVDTLNDKILAVANDAFKDAVEQLEDAKKQLNDSAKTIADNKEKLAESQQDLEDGKQELIDGQKEIDDGYNELASKQQELDNGISELENGQEQLDKAKNDAYAQMAAASTALDQLNAYEAQLTGQQAEAAAYDAMIQGAQAIQGIEAIVGLFPADNTDKVGDSELAARVAQILGISEEQVKEMTNAGVNAALTAAKAAIEAQGIDSAKVDEYKAKKADAETSAEITKQIIEGYKSQLGATTYADIEKAKLEAASKFGSTEAQMAITKGTLDSAQSQLDSARDQLDTAKEQLQDGWDAITDGQTQIDDGWKSLRDGEKQLQDGWDDYNDAVRQYEKQKKEALKKANADDLLGLPTLAQLIYAQNFAMPAGYIDDKLDNSWLVEVGDNFTSVEELRDSVLCHIDDVGDVKVSDVADINIIDNSQDSYVRLDGERAIVLSVFKSSTSGTNDVSTKCKDTIESLKGQFEGLNIMILSDQGDYISLIVNSVLQSMLIGAALAIFILAIFLKDVKPTIVVAISIPLSVLMAIVTMYFTGITLNILSLSGLALGIGMLVDNSVVVIENIYRLRNRGIPAPRAAVQGTKQVAGSIFASTLTTICVFFPMLYTNGMVRDLLMPMCLTIIYCLVASLVIAMTVVPASCSTVLRNTNQKEHPWFDKMMKGYEKSLRYCLDHKWLPITVAVGLLGVSIYLVVSMGIVMIPELTANQIQASVTIEEEYNRDESYSKMDLIMEKLLQVDGIGSIGILDGGMIVAGMGGGQNNFRQYSLMILTEDPNAGKKDIYAINKAMEAAVSDIEGIEFSVSSAMGEMSQIFGSGLAINIYGSDINEDLRISEDIMKIVDSVEGYTDISNEQEDADQVLHLKIDKNKAMGLGLSVAQIYQELAAEITTEVDSITVTIDGLDMKVKISDEMTPVTKENLMDYVFTVNKKDEDGDQVTEDHPLSDFAQVNIRPGVSTINRENQNRYITVTAGIEEGYNTTVLTRKLKPLIEAYEVPEGYSISIGGEYDSVVEMLTQMGLVTVLGFAFIYFVMVAQFQSLLSPFIILFTIPLAFTGGFFSLWIAGENLSIISLIGIIVLMGTVVNNGIVFVDYVNQLRMGGLERKEALVASGITRMRPILMTALTTILAESNLIFGQDMGAQMGRGMALVIAGGLAYATLMTLYIIPVMYDIMFKKPPLNIDVGSDLEDELDDAAEYMMEHGLVAEERI